MYGLQPQCLSTNVCDHTPSGTNYHGGDLKRDLMYELWHIIFLVCFSRCSSTSSHVYRDKVKYFEIFKTFGRYSLQNTPFVLSGVIMI